MRSVGTVTRSDEKVWLLSVIFVSPLICSETVVGVPWNTFATLSWPVSLWSLKSQATLSLLARLPMVIVGLLSTVSGAPFFVQLTDEKW